MLEVRRVVDTGRQHHHGRPAGGARDGASRREPSEVVEELPRVGVDRADPELGEPVGEGARHDLPVRENVGDAAGCRAGCPRAPSSDRRRPGSGRFPRRGCTGRRARRCRRPRGESGGPGRRAGAARSRLAGSPARGRRRGRNGSAPESAAAGPLRRPPTRQPARCAGSGRTAGCARCPDPRRSRR